MSIQAPLDVATAGLREVPFEWMSATQVRSLIFEDPCTLWLRYHGKKHGFQPNTGPYEWLDFISNKGRQFEEKWITEVAPDAVRVCQEAYDVRSVEKVQETFELMKRGTPVIAQPALWWAPERIYGVPDVLVHTSWLNDRFPGLLNEGEQGGVAVNLESVGEGGYYLVLDNKFTSKLEESGKAKDLLGYTAQVRIYSYMVGQLQGHMPKRGYLIPRDRIFVPLPVNITSELDQPLEEDLAALRDQVVDIKVNGANYVPWRDDVVSVNVSNEDQYWRTAKGIIAREKVPGRDPGLLYQIGLGAKRELKAIGYPSLDSMLQGDPEKIPFESCRGLGPAKSKRMRAILQANQLGSPLLPPSGSIPTIKPFEFYVDFEYFNNVNVDFERQWPTLDGCEMVFMVGVGWQDKESWAFRRFACSAEDQIQERELFEEFLAFLSTQTQGAFTDKANTTLYHWSNAEVWQARRTSDRHQLPESHPLRKLPWYDLQKVFLNGPCSLPGAWGFGLKGVAKALAELDSSFDPQWPGDLDEGLLAMVMGWKAYETARPLESEEMQTLTQYLEADCKAVCQLLKWLRS